MARPGIFLVTDHKSEQAANTVARMLNIAELSRDDQVHAVIGDEWAAAAIAPPADVPSAGADAIAQGRDRLIWTGEVYLPDSWRNNDTGILPQHAIAEAILAKLQTVGTEALAELDGAFCGAWYESARHRWHIFNDRLGSLPIFWACDNGKLIVGTHARIVAFARNRDIQVSIDGVTDLLRAQNMVDDHTLIEGVHWLVGAHVLTFAAGNIDSHRYWDFAFHTPTTQDESTLRESFWQAFAPAVRRALEDSSDKLLALSGGMDSRMILAAAIECGQAPPCFSTGWDCSEDVRFGRNLAKAAGTSHEQVLLDGVGLPDRLRQLVIETDGLHGAAHLVFASCVPAYLANHRGSVLLEGHFLGVIGGGYVPCEADLHSRFAPNRRQWALKHLHSNAEPMLINGLLQIDLARESFARWSSRVDDAYRNAPCKSTSHRVEYTIAAGRSGRNDMLGPSLWRTDTLLRQPGCDRQVLDWYLGAPAEMRRGKQFYANLLNKRFPRLARVQRSDHNGLPITKSWLSRNWHWQCEKFWRMRFRRYDERFRQWGCDGRAVRAWAWEIWRNTGELNDLLLSKQSRITPWVSQAVLQNLWNKAETDPMQGVPLYALATAEIMIRHLEQMPKLQQVTPVDIEFKPLNYSRYSSGQPTSCEARR